MQAVILAGGFGKRLTPLTKGLMPKPMVPLLGVPLLERQICCLKREGVTDFFLIVGYLGSVIKKYFDTGKKYGVEIQYYEEKEPLGTGGALPIIQDSLKDDFFLLFGDLLFDVSLDKIRKFHYENASILTMVVHPNTHPYDSDLVLVDRTNKVKALDLKNCNRSYWFSNLVNAGIYLANKEICSYVPHIKHGRTIDLEKDVVTNVLAKKKNVYAYRTSEYLKDVGTLERIVSAERDLREGKVESRNLNKKQKAIFLDRDGTINRCCGYIDSPNKFALESGVAKAIKKINDSGYLAIVITNQPVVARGLATIDQIELINKKMETLLGNEGAYLDKIYYCPHHPDAGFPGENKLYKIQCFCRKPSIGMIETASEEFNLDLTKCWLIGDTTVDIKTAENAGIRSILVMTGEKGLDNKYSVCPDFVMPDLRSAVDLILGDGNGR